MVIIADCGATKCDWLIVRGERDQQLENTAGFSPFLNTSEEIQAIVATQLASKLNASAVTNIWFYGTGVHDEHRVEIVEKALKAVFPNAVIEIEHDLLASARAACGHNPGIACILGTGSNSCYYDGKQIVDSVESLGWLLGDEGSGNHLGKALLRAWFYRELPVDLDKAFRLAYPEGGDAIKDKIYEKGANAYIASFTTFLTDHLKHPYIQKLIAASLGEFLDRTVCKYPGHQQVPINFVGSIAHHFEAILKKCMAERNLEMGVIIRKPIYPLAEYHVKTVEG
jgi:glucosamine kinase